MTRKNKSETAFLLDPQFLPLGKPVVELINIIRANGAVDFKTHPLTNKTILTNLRNYPLSVKDALLACSMEAVEEKNKKLVRAGVVNNTPPGALSPTSKEFIKHWYHKFNSLQPFFPLLKWYYKKQQPQKKRPLTAPCRFSSFKPTLSFEVQKKDHALHLKANICLGDSTIPLERFTRYHFLLVDKNEFFVLNFEDYETLEKVENLEFSKYNHDPAQFAKHILTKIEKRYPVNRNNHIPVIEIDNPPVFRVLLNELNQRFLMLTPQWLYDGIVIDNSINSEKEISRNGIIYSVKRDKDAEQEFEKMLADLHKNFANQRNGYFYLSFDNATKGQWFFKTYQKLLNMNIEIAGMDMLAHFRYSPYLPETKMELEGEKEGALQYKVEVTFGNEAVPLGQLQKILLAGQKAVMLKDGSLGILGEQWLSQYASLFMHGKIDKKQLHISRWMAVPEQEKNQPLTQALKKEWWAKWNAWHSGNDALYPIPTTLQANLRPYQRKGYEWLLLLEEIGAGACLADDMGLGKSLQSIAAITYFTGKNPELRSIVVCPASLIYTWREEFEKFAPSIKTLVYHGADRREDQLEEGGLQVIITTYSTLRNDVDKITAQSFGVAVLDESHNIKNPLAQISQAVMKTRARFRIALSGTPVINNTFDLYSQLQFVVPGLFGSREFFKTQYANPIDFFQDKEKIAALQKLTAPFILRRTKEQVAPDLPEKTESILWCSMGVDQRSIYEEILESTRSSLFLEIRNSGLEKSKFSILQAMTKLRQVCSSPQLVQLEDVLSCQDSVKLTNLMGELDNILSKHKVIVFSQFTRILELIGDECEKKGIGFYHFDGQTPPAKRAEMVQSFQDEENDVHLFLISLKAGNTGLTLTAADYVFLFDPWWNSAVENQAIDRTHRIGQTKNVFAYKLICKDTIEEKIISLQRKKQKLSDDLVAADNNFVKSLTEEDVQFLFS